MANVPVTGVAATIGSVTSGTDLAQLVATATDFVAFVPTIVADSADTTPLAGNTMRMTNGLQQWEVGFRAVYPRTTPRFGASGLVTFASGFVRDCSRFDVTFDWGAEDITAYTGAAQTFKRFRPGSLPSISGSFNALVQDDATPSAPTTVNNSGQAVSFKLAEDGATDPTLAGNIVVTNEGYAEISRASRKLEVTYQFVGSGTALWTISAGSTLPALLPAGDIDEPDWDTNADGTPDVSATFTLASGRTLSGPCFLRSLTLASQVNGLIAVSGVIQGAGTLTRA